MNKLKHTIKSKGLIQKWLANKLDIHEVMMSYYAKGLIMPRKKTRDKIANYLNVPEGELFPPQPKHMVVQRKRRKRAIKPVIPVPDGYIKI